MSRLYAERDASRRRRLGDDGLVLRWVALELEPASMLPDSALHGPRPFFADPVELREHPERFWLEADGVDRLLAGGDRCLAIRDGEEIVYRATVMSDPGRVAAVLVPRGLAEPAWIVSGVLTHPAHRGRRLHTTAMAWLGGEARRAGVRWIVAWIAAWNRSSERAFARAGFRPLGEGPAGSRER